MKVLNLPRGSMLVISFLRIEKKRTHTVIFSIEEEQKNKARRDTIPRKGKAELILVQRKWKGGNGGGKSKNKHNLSGRTTPPEVCLVGAGGQRCPDRGGESVERKEKARKRTALRKRAVVALREKGKRRMRGKGGEAHAWGRWKGVEEEKTDHVVAGSGINAHGAQ